MTMLAMQKNNVRKQVPIIRELRDLPPVFPVKTFASTFHISLKLAFEVVKKEKLAIRIGNKRILCLKERVIEWANKQ